MEKIIFVPADVPTNQHKTFQENYAAITHNTGRLMLFACDQKIEHLNQDFYGPGIPAEINHPEHLFKIASQGRIGAMATHLGLIARYGRQYPEVNYIAKLNGKTPLVPTEQEDPLSPLLWDVEQLVELKENAKLNIRGIGLTVYLGSEYEAQMLETAAQTIWDAHQYGLVTILWMYPRGKAVKNERDGALIAGAAGVANSLNADFAKVNPPDADATNSSAQWLKVAQEAAGNTKLICSGGKTVAPEQFIKELREQLTVGGIFGTATGRNIHARPLKDAVEMTKAISAVVIDGK
jgi:fructose-bisphosphate aldolase / 6-deoxy-5-ketofructose 1-phosphate synthase